MCCFIFDSCVSRLLDSNHNTKQHLRRFAIFPLPPAPSNIALSATLKSHSFVVSPPPLKIAPLLLLSLLSSLSLLFLSTLGLAMSTKGMGVRDLCRQICNNNNDPPPAPLLRLPSLACQLHHVLRHRPRPAGGGPSLPWKILPPQCCGHRSLPPNVSAAAVIVATAAAATAIVATAVVLPLPLLLPPPSSLLTLSSPPPPLSSLLPPLPSPLPLRCV